MLKKVIPALIFIAFLASCGPQPEEQTKEQEQEKVDKVEQVEEVGQQEEKQVPQPEEKEDQEKSSPTKEEQEAASKFFEEMIIAANENDKEKFLSYQDESNALFYKEQEGMLQSLEQKKKEGWEVSVVMKDVTLESPEEGSIELQFNMKHGDQDIKNHITFPIHKVNDSWKMNDLPFEKITAGPINLYYVPSLANKAERVLADVKELIDLYSTTFGWEPEEVNIKLYDKVEEISASTGWPTLYGVSVPFISSKFVVEGSYDVAFGFMKHEIVHTMLADITNDNATPFLQEGLAIFISNSVTQDSNGKLLIDFDKTQERENFILNNTEEIKPIADLGDINYTDNSIDIYNVGFLITDYLMQTYGIEKYLEMASILKENEIIDGENPERDQIAYNHTIEAIEKTYGPLDKLSEGYMDYFAGRADS